MTYKTHITDFGQVASCSADKQECPYGQESETGFNGHLIFNDVNEAMRYNELRMEQEHGGSFGNSFSIAKQDELETIELEATRRAQDAVKFALHHVPHGTPSVALNTKDKKYGGFTGGFPAINGAVIQMEDTDEVFEIHTEVVGENLKGTEARLNGYVKDSNGTPMPRYIPGPSFRIISIPETIAAKSVLKHEVLAKELITAQRSYDAAIGKLQDSIYSDAKRDVSISVSHFEQKEGAAPIKRIKVSGANKDGTKSFSYLISETGDVEVFRQSGSNFDKKTLGILSSQKEELAGIFKKLNSADAKRAEFVSSQKKNFKYNNYL